MSTLKGIVTLALLALHTTFWCALLYALGIVRLVTPGPRARSAIARPMYRIIDGWVYSNRLVFRLLGTNRVSTRWEFDGPLSTDGWYIVISNHQGWADVLILQDVLLGKIPPLKFFVKRPLLWVPLIGIAMWFLDFPYVYRYSRERIAANPTLRERDVAAVRAACEHFKVAPSSVLNFLEGTRFTPQKRARQRSVYTHLLTPKVGGLHQVFLSLANRIDGIIDITIVYPGAVPSFWDYLCGRGDTPIVEIRSQPVPALTWNGDSPTDEGRAQIRGWVDGLWARKDRRVGELAEMA